MVQFTASLCSPSISRSAFSYASFKSIEIMTKIVSVYQRNYAWDVLEADSSQTLVAFNKISQIN